MLVAHRLVTYGATLSLHLLDFWQLLRAGFLLDAGSWISASS
jgi:hypothetical protein